MSELAIELKSYAMGLVDQISKEYESQMGKWRDYHLLVADAHATAYANFTNALNKIRQLQAAEEAANREIGIFAITLLSVPVLSWISGAIAYKIYPRAVAIRNPDFIRNNVINKSWDAFTKAAEKGDYSKVTAKVFGDTISKYTGFAIDDIAKRLMSNQELPSNTVPGQINFTSAGAEKFVSYKTSLELALNTEVGRLMKQLAVFRGNLNNDDDFGDRFAQEVYKIMPDPRVSYRDQLKEGKRQINQWFDALRQLWANDWAFYRNNPVLARLPYLPGHIEMGIWALWILGSKWESKFVDLASDDPEVVSYWETDDGFQLWHVLGALSEFAYRETMTYTAHMSQTVPDVVMDEVNSVQKLYDAVERKREEDVKMQKLLDWAKSNPAQMSHPDLDYRARNLGTVSDPPSLFAD